MKKENSVLWQVFLVLALVGLSLAVYLVHFLIFRDLHHILIYGLGELAFIPIEVLVVTVIIHRLLEEREKRAKLLKLNMVIGTFFSEVGTGLLRQFRVIDRKKSAVEEDLAKLKSNPGTDFAALASSIKSGDFEVECRPEDLRGLQHFLHTKRDFLLRLLENPYLLEHEAFTELLWAVTHLAEELAFRTDVGKSPPADHKHLLGDINRAYGHLVREWLRYMGHLKAAYPYLFSLSLRLNPFDPEAKAEVQG